MRNYFVIMSFLLLAGCSSTLDMHTVPDERLHLNISNPPPLQMKSVVFKIQTDAGEKIYILDQRNFDNLMLNFDQIQNRSLLDTVIIKKYKDYYEGK